MAKGANFERDMCRTLSLWWSEGKRDDVFWRSAGSGAMAKTRSKSGKGTSGQYGDIHASDPEGLPFLEAFTIELKRGYNDVTLSHMLDKPDSAAVQIWERFYQQVYEDHLNAGSMSWMLICQRDRRKALVHISQHSAMMLHKFGAEVNKIPYLRGRVPLKDGKHVHLYVCALDDFLQVVKPYHVKATVQDGYCS